MKIIAQNRPDLTEQLEKTRTSFLNYTDQLSTTIESLCVILFGQSDNGKFRSNAGLEQLRGWFEKSTSQKYVVDLAGTETLVADVFRLRQLAVRQVQVLAPELKDLFALRDEALATLRAAEQELSGAEKRYEQAQHASQAAGESVKEAAKLAGLG